MTQASTDQLVWMCSSPKYALRSGFGGGAGAAAEAEAEAVTSLAASAEEFAGAGDSDSFFWQAPSVAIATIAKDAKKTREVMAVAPE
jgi:hypothetical protein